eukprot:scaffold234665_cov31-Tisochrysis_lutea.AAC.2
MRTRWADSADVLSPDSPAATRAPHRIRHSKAASTASYASQMRDPSRMCSPHAVSARSNAARTFSTPMLTSVALI